MVHVVPSQHLHAAALRLLAGKAAMDPPQLAHALFATLGRLRSTLPEADARGLDQAIAAASALRAQLTPAGAPDPGAGTADLRDLIDLLSLPGVEAQLPAALARRLVQAGPRELRSRQWLAWLPPTGFLLTRIPTLRVQPFRRAVIACDPGGAVTTRLPGAHLLSAASGEITPPGSPLRVHRGADVTVGVLRAIAERTPIAWLRLRILPDARLDLGFQLRIPRQPVATLDVLHRDGRVICQAWLLVDRAGASTAV